MTRRLGELTKEHRVGPGALLWFPTQAQVSRCVSQRDSVHYGAVHYGVPGSLRGLVANTTPQRVGHSWTLCASSTHRSYRSGGWARGALIVPDPGPGFMLRDVDVTSGLARRVVLVLTGAAGGPLAGARL